MIESVLRGGYAERDVIDARESPGITGPARKESYDRRRVIIFRKRRAIAEGYLHLRRRQRARESLRYRTVRSVRCDEHGRAPPQAVFALQYPVFRFIRACAKRDALPYDVRS